MDNKIIYLAVIILIFLSGMFVQKKFFEPEVDTVYKETFKSDTVFVEIRDTVVRTKIKQVYLRDTLIVFGKDSVNLPLQAFTELYPNIYGDVSVFGEVAGKLTKLGVSTNFNIPSVTNTITKETVRTIKPSGLYLAGGFQTGDSQLSAFVGASYLKNKSLIFYNYNLVMKSHQAGIGVKLF